MSSSESDDAPDSVSFTAGREKALKKLKEEKSQHKFDADKQWRKQREMQYKEQKEKKLLSYEILMEADKELEKNEVQDHLDSCESDENEEGSESPSQDFSEERFVITDFIIPLYSSVKHYCSQEGVQQTVEVSVVNVRKPKPLMKSPLDFKQEAMYGKRLKRVDAAHVKRIRAKRRANLQRKSAAK